MTFTITDEQMEVIKAWKVGQDAKADAINARRGQEKPKGWKGVYYGCTGGGYDYCFMPTSLDVVVILRNAVTGETLDLTEYDKW